MEEFIKKIEDAFYQAYANIMLEDDGIIIEKEKFIKMINDFIIKEGDKNEELGRVYDSWNKCLKKQI